MINIRQHHFDDIEDVIITGLLPTGEYGCYRESADEGRVRGYGATRFGAIADMVENYLGLHQEGDR